MAYLEVSAFKKLKAFFWALQKSGFNLNKLPAKDNEGMPVDKAYCLNLLHSFPDFQGEQFKDDNTIVKYLSKPGNIKQILDQFTPEQQIELTKVFEERPVAVEAVGEQPVGQTPSAEQDVPTQIPGGEPAGTMLGGIPSVNVPQSRRIIRNVQQTKPPETAEPPLEKRVPGLKNTPETGLDHEGKPYEMGAEYKKPSATKTESPPAGRTERRFQAPKIPAGMANIGKNFASRAGIFLNRNIIPIARTGLGAFAGGVLTGGNPLALLGGGIGGATFNAWGRKVLNGSINAGVALSHQVSRGSLVKLQGRKAAVGLILLLVIPVLLATAFTGIPGGTSTTGGGTTTSGGTVGNLSSCIFTRGDQSPASTVFKSQTLLGYFQEVSAKSGVPAVVLAGIARIESPGIVNFTNDNLASYGCPTSETGAKGLMQVQPPGTTGYSAAGVSLGAQYLGVTVDQLNFCDLRQNIFLGAGVVNVKVGGSWDSTKTNDKSYIDGLAAGYYGCLRYGGPPGTRCDDPRRNYSYGDDLFKSISECKPPSPTPTVGNIASCPVVGGSISTSSYNADPNRGHCSPGYRGCQAECRTTGRRARAIDVRTEGKDVTLPKLQGQTVQWTLINPPYSIAADDGGGWGYTFRTTYGGDTWYIDMLHLLSSSTVVKDGAYPSGHAIGKVDAGALARVGSEPHVHTTIGKNLTTPVSSGSLNTDCDSNWIPSDFMCQ